MRERDARQEAFDAAVVAGELEEAILRNEEAAVATAAPDGEGLHDSVYGPLDPVTDLPARPGSFDTLFEAHAERVPASRRDSFLASRETYRQAGARRMAIAQLARRSAYEGAALAKLEDRLLAGIRAGRPVGAASEERHALAARMGADVATRQRLAAAWEQKAAHAYFAARLDGDPDFAGKARGLLGLATPAIQGGSARAASGTGSAATSSTAGAAISGAGPATPGATARGMAGDAIPGTAGAPTPGATGTAIPAIASASRPGAADATARRVAGEPTPGAPAATPPEAVANAPATPAPDPILSVLPESERRLLASQAEARDAADRAAYQVRFDDYLAELGAGSLSEDPAFAADIAATRLPPARASTAAQDLAEARAIGAHRNALAYAPTSEIEAYVSERLPAAQDHAQAGDERVANFGPGPDAPARSREQRRIATVLAARQQALREDPAAYVSGLPLVGTALKALTERPDDPNAARDYATKVLAVQERLGVPAETQRVLSVQQVTELAARFTKGTENVALQMRAEARRWGLAWNQVFGELAGSGLIPGTALVIGTMNKPMQRLAADKLAEAARLGRVLETKLAPEAVAVLAEGLKLSFAPFGRLLSALGGPAVSVVNAFSDSIYRVSLSYAQADNPESAITRAIRDVAGFGKRIVEGADDSNRRGEAEPRRSTDPRQASGVGLTLELEDHARANLGGSVAGSRAEEASDDGFVDVVRTRSTALYRGPSPFAATLEDDPIVIWRAVQESGLDAFLHRVAADEDPDGNERGPRFGSGTGLRLHSPTGLAPLYPDDVGPNGPYDQLDRWIRSIVPEGGAGAGAVRRGKPSANTPEGATDRVHSVFHRMNLSPKSYPGVSRQRHN